MSATMSFEREFITIALRIMRFLRIKLKFETCHPPVAAGINIIPRNYSSVGLQSMLIITPPSANDLLKSEPYKWGTKISIAFPLVGGTATNYTPISLIRG